MLFSFFVSIIKVVPYLLSAQSSSVCYNCNFTEQDLKSLADFNSSILTFFSGDKARKVVTGCNSYH